MLKRILLGVAFVLLLLALALLYVGGVASVSDWAVHKLRVAPRLAPAGAEVVDNWAPFAETAHFSYYVRPGDRIPRWAMELAEVHLDTACRTLLVSFTGAIAYYKHPSQADLREATGSRSTGLVLIASDKHHQELHSVHAYDPHEVMHAIAHETMGEPPAFFDEGLATAFGWDWTPGENDVHQRARGLLDEGRLVLLERLLTNWDFRSYKTYPAYTTAGSFIKYVLALYGPEKLAGLFELDKLSTLDEITQHFATTYGKDIHNVEAAWRAELAQGTLPTSPNLSVSSGNNTSLFITGAFLFFATFVGAMMAIVAGERIADATANRARALRRLLSFGPHE